MKKHLRKTLRRIGKWVSRLARAVRKAWHQHLDQMATEPGYAGAFVAVVFAAVELFAGPRVRWVAQRLVVAYVALLRALEPPPGGEWA